MKKPVLFCLAQLALLGFLGLMVPAVAQAGALKGVVSAVESPLFDQPNENSKVKEVLKAGEPLALNEATRDGFYYGRTRSGGLGWVRMLDVRVVGRFDPLAAAAEKEKSGGDASKRGGRPWRVLLGYGLNGFAHSDIVSQTVSGDLDAGGGSFGLEVNYLPQPRWAFGMRVAKLAQTLQLICTDGTSEVNCDFEVGAYEAAAGVRYRTPLSEMVRLELGVFGGMGFGGKLRVSEETGGFSQIEGGGYVFHLDAAIEVELSRKMSIFGQMGYHAFKGSQIQPIFGGTSGTPDSALFDKPAALDLSGLAVMFGVGFRLPW